MYCTTTYQLQRFSQVVGYVPTQVPYGIHYGKTPTTQRSFGITNKYASLKAGFDSAWEYIKLAETKYDKLIPARSRLAMFES